MAMRRARMAKERSMLAADQPHNLLTWSINEQNTRMKAVIRGPSDSPYEHGVFELELDLPEKYPLEPPRMRFITPIYHPNIDSAGRICLDTLNMQPKGNWSPACNLRVLIITIGQLMANPNPEDGLMPDVTKHYRENRASFDLHAREMTRKHATQQKLNTNQHTDTLTQQTASDSSSSTATSSSSNSTTSTTSTNASPSPSSFPFPSSSSSSSPSSISQSGATTPSAPIATKDDNGAESNARPNAKSPTADDLPNDEAENTPPNKKQKTK